jgi:hypothetical protein
MEMLAESFCSPQKPPSEDERDDKVRENKERKLSYMFIFTREMTGDYCLAVWIQQFVIRKSEHWTIATIWHDDQAQIFRHVLLDNIAF